ncbi:MAG: hypothetical protein KIT11_00930 [Fimbriimonadaceae bacterium]|nr:hypothetical protein [Fimbriimonadaceae bacterium]QYK55063.1 MAG: hypothetical protein KF733_08605 [Fimbriimonadaceae bacterium]
MTTGSSLWLSRRLTILALLTTAVLAVAQEEGSATATDEPETPPPAWSKLTIGYRGRDITRNSHKLFQYATPVQGFDLVEFSTILPGDGASQPWGRLRLNGTWLSDNVQQGTLIFANGRARIDLDANRFNYDDPSPVVFPDSRDQFTRAALSYRFTPGIVAFASYRERKQNKNYEGPKPSLDTYTRETAVGTQGQVLGGTLAVTASEERFNERNDALPLTIYRRVDASYGIDVTPDVSLEGVYATTRIQQRNERDSNVKSLALRGGWDIGPETNLSAEFRRVDLSLPAVQNAFVRQQWVSGAKLSHRFSRAANVQLAYRHREYERLRSDQSYVDVPKWNEFEARVSGRLGSAWHYTVRGSIDHMQSLPKVQTGTDFRSLWWDDRSKLDARIDFDWDRLNAYASYGYRFRQNEPRNVEISLNTLTVGAAYTFNERTQAYAEVYGEQYRVAGNPELDGYFPSATSIAFGAAHQFDDATSFSLAIQHTFANNDNPLGLPEGNVRNTELTATLRRDLGERQTLELFVAPWAYKDRVDDTYGYRATFFGLNWTVKF